MPKENKHINICPLSSLKYLHECFQIITLLKNNLGVVSVTIAVVIRMLCSPRQSLPSVVYKVFSAVLGHGFMMPVCCGCYFLFSPHGQPVHKSLGYPDQTVSWTCLEGHHLQVPWMHVEEPSLQRVVRDILFRRWLKPRSEGGWVIRAKIWQKSVQGRRTSMGKGPEVEASLVHCRKVRKRCSWREINGSSSSSGSRPGRAIR